MVQTLARCRSCGLPTKLAENVDWGSGGIITLRRQKGMRLVMLDSGTMARIDEIMRSWALTDDCMEMEKRATRRATQDYLAGLKAKLSRYGVVKKRVLEMIEGHSLLLGMGRIELEKFTPGEKGSLVLRRPFDARLVSAVICGALEGVDRCRYSYELSSETQDSFRLVMRVKENGEEEYGDTVKPKTASRAAASSAPLKTCRECRMPSPLGEFMWDEVFGTVNAGPGGRRVALLPAYMLSVISRCEPGTDVVGKKGILEEAVFGSTMADFREKVDDAYGAGVNESLQEEDLRRILMTRGWGTLREAETAEIEWRLSVLNPVNDALLAGWMRALYTVVLGKEPEIEIEAESQYTVYSLR